ncbi:hypothetical protein N0V84_000174 [Fusarium piperis]|uniref:Uncharacterized protein n=1 Tax=Fusarium piperis TaxID=1435070 RepID=A0A9W8WNP7_9HYPO|nr:hypothetical protein N0V84_000174 [Fusarium piperis]
MSGIISAIDSEPEAESDVPQPVSDDERSPEAFDHDFKFDVRDIPHKSDVGGSPGAVVPADGDACDEEC